MVDGRDKAGNGASGGDGAQEGEQTRLTFDEALKLAIEMHQGGQIEGARHIYLRLLEADPDNADAMHFLGVASHQQGNTDEALKLIGKAHELAPESPGILMNLGNVCLEAGRTDEALDAYRRMVELEPENAGAWNNIGVLLRAIGRPELAEEALRKALEVNPDDAGPWHNLGNLLLSIGRTEEAVKCGLRSLTLLPKNNVGRKLLAIAYAYLGEKEKAIAVFHEWLEESPGDPTAEHYLAALEGRVPERASDAYVEKVFDDFAVSFDSRLEHLEYRAPELVRAELASRLEGLGPVEILDVGCGTGLCGPLVRGLASRLVGIDLSAKMLARAQRRDVYDALEKAEFIAYLSGIEEGYDAIIAADALCYVGQMDSFAEHALRAMRPGAPLVATFEANEDDEDIALPPTGRYTHGRDYLERTFEVAGFTDITIVPCILRLEQAVPVNGWLLSAIRPD